MPGVPLPPDEAGEDEDPLFLLPEAGVLDAGFQIEMFRGEVAGG